MALENKRLNCEGELKNKLDYLSNYFRKKAFETILNAKSGHLGASSSSAEMMTSLYFGGGLDYDVSNPNHSNRDRVLVRGHVGPLRYSIFSALGWINESELMGYRKINSRLEGHESMSLDGVDITPSGSLGMLLGYGVGSAVSAKNMNKTFKTLVFLGDGEEQEGNVSESARSASHLELDNLVCIIDKNGKQLGFSTNSYESKVDLKKIWTGYGRHVIEVNGHNVTEFLNALSKKVNNKPKLIIANTIKGYGLESCLDSNTGYHTISSCKPKIIKDGIKKLEEKFQFDSEKIQGLARELTADSYIKYHSEEDSTSEVIVQSCFPGENLRELTGEVLQNLIASYDKLEGERLYIMTADFLRDRDQERLKKNSSSNIYIYNVGIKEQHLLSMAHGISQIDQSSRIVIFAGEAFMYRCADQLNVLSQAKSNVVIVGLNPGLCGSKNGHTHQSVSQQGMIGTMHGLEVLEPGDTNDLINCFQHSLNSKSGPIYIRVHDKGFTLKENTQNNNIDSYVAYEPNSAEGTIITSGLILENAVHTAKELKSNMGIGIRVINVINPNSLSKVLNILEPTKPIFVIYNGKVSHFAGKVTLEMIKNQINFSGKLITHGFTRGKSGSLENLIEHFGFDKKGLKNLILNNIGHENSI